MAVVLSAMIALLECESSHATDATMRLRTGEQHMQRHGEMIGVPDDGRQ